MSERRGGAGIGYSALSYVLAGPLLYGGLGWVGDHAWRTTFLTPLGVVLGLALSVCVVYKRFGTTVESSDQNH